VVIIGVMGAGLLTFVGRDLNSVIEANRGQRALELADAGVAAAKRQLTRHCGGDANCGVLYDGGGDDLQWSADEAQGGMTLTGLDGSATIPNEVNVAIAYMDGTKDFKVISTGYYGVATRKVEAIFKGIVTFGGGDQAGHPLYYTPSDIKIEATRLNPVDIRTISMFSAGDILVQGDYENDLSDNDDIYGDNVDGISDDRERFIAEMDVRSGGPNADVGFLESTGQGQGDALEDWCTTTACNTQSFRKIPGNWNTVQREEDDDVYSGGSDTVTRHRDGRDLNDPGLAAEGKICGFSAADDGSTPAIGECPSTYRSIADGVFGYDCTTGNITVDKVNPVDNELVCPSPVDPNLPAPPQARGNSLTFMAKECTPTNCDTTQTTLEGRYITYPFPLPEPDPAALYRHADLGDDVTDKLWEECDPTVECSPPFEELLGSKNEMAFVDANGATVNLEGNALKGTLVVWCGHLKQISEMQGVILNLHGDGSTFEASNCEGDGTKGTYRNMGTTFSGWLYADGGTEQMAGIELAPGSVVNKFPGGRWNFELDAFDNVPPNAFSLRGWRECYQLEPATECST
jgi:hypothetical protein